MDPYQGKQPYQDQPGNPHQPPPYSPNAPPPGAPVGYGAPAPPPQAAPIVYGSPPPPAPIIVQAPPPAPAAPQVMVTGNCPNCRIGRMNTTFTVCGILCALFLFPLGLLCCFLWREKRCSNCGVSFG